jgi:hypothetical protein
VTTNQGRSFAGLAAAHLALTVVACGGLVLLLPAVASSQGLPSTISAICARHCDASDGPADDHQLTADTLDFGALDPDAAPKGSDAAIAADPSRTIGRSNLMEAFHVAIAPWISRSIDVHSLRAPPGDEQTSSDADLDDDDDDQSAEYSVLLPPATGCEKCLFTPVRFVTTSSTRSSVLSLRAPPL